jgi:hypothetical protein
MSFYPESVTNQGMCSNSLFFCCFHLGLTFESIKELGSTSCSFSFFIRYIYPPYCCYSLFVAPFVNILRLLVDPLVAIFYLFITTCHLCFLGWYSFHLIFFLQVVFWVTTIKQKPARKVSFFLKTNSLFIWTFSIFLNFFFVHCDTIYFCFDFVGKRKKTKNCLIGKAFFMFS